MRSLAAADRRISGAEPGAPPLPPARGADEPAAGRPTASRSSPARATRGFRSRRGARVRAAICSAAAAAKHTPAADCATRRRSSRRSSSLQARFRGSSPTASSATTTLGRAEPGPGRARARQLAIAMERLRWLRARPAADADRRQHRRGLPRLLARRTARRPPQGRRRRGRTSRRRSSRRRSSALVAKPTWRVPERDRREGAREQEPGLARGQQFRR